MPSVWYLDGLRFSCTRCGNCCGGESGSVRIDESETRTLARRFEVSPEQFRAMYAEPRGDAVSLRERANGDCIFYDRSAGCSVYEDRPRQCRTWPFWRANLQSADTWSDAAAHCPGMNQGPLIDAESIAAVARADGTSGSPRKPSDDA